MSPLHGSICESSSYGVRQSCNAIIYNQRSRQNVTRSRAFAVPPNRRRSHSRSQWLING